MLILAIDPGTTKSAYVVYDGDKPIEFDWLDNHALLGVFDGWKVGSSHLVVEEIESYGKPVGREVFQAVLWVGRFIQAWEPGQWSLLPRRAIKRHLCNSVTAKDSMIRQSLLDKFGPGRDVAIGRKASPGPLYGLSGDCWSALAVAVTWWDEHAGNWPCATG